MRIQKTKIFLGGNVFHHAAAVMASFNLEELADSRLDEMPNLRKRVSETLPTLSERLDQHRELALAALTLEIARELLSREGLSARFTRLLPAEPDGFHRILVETCAPEATKALLDTALRMIQAFARDQDFEPKPLSPGIAPDPELRELLEAARQAGVPCLRTDPARLLIGYGKNLRAVELNGSNRSELLRTARNQLATVPANEFRIPIVSITGTNGKTTVTRMIGHILAEAGKKVGMTTTSGIYVDRICLKEGDWAGPRSAQGILANPGVDVAVLETSRGGIIRAGLGYDRSDVGVLTNIQPDHIGQDGVRSIDDLTRIKRVVVDGVRPDGTLVLNAEDEASALFHELPNAILISLDPLHPRVARNTAAGKKAYVLKEGWLTELEAGKELPVFPVSDLSGAFGGTARFQVANALAAIAAVRALGLDLPATTQGLRSFENETHNPGRNNLFRLPSGYLLADYGHNPEAIRAVGKMTQAWKVRDLTLVMSLPGDRADSVLEDCARIAARHFPKIILKDDADLRGRPAGQLPELLKLAIQDENPEAEVDIVLDEESALRKAVNEMKPGGMTVIFHEQWDVVRRCISEFSELQETHPEGTIPC